MENDLRIGGREESVFWTSSPTVELVSLAMLPLWDSGEDFSQLTAASSQPQTAGCLAPAWGIYKPWVEKEPWRPTSTHSPAPSRCPRKPSRQWPSSDGCCWFAQSNSFSTPRTVAHQAPLPMGFSRWESWSGFPFSPPGDRANPRIKHASSALAGRFFTTEPPGKTANNVTGDFKPPMAYTLPWNFPKI